jgi:ribonucleoside-diphosphate reductase beta chain
LHAVIPAKTTTQADFLKMNTTTITLGDRQFTLDRDKAEAAFAAKRVINGRQTMFFNILPLKYTWAYDLYKKMKANHWEPEDVPMQKDCEHWRDTSGMISDVDRWIIKMGIGYFRLPRASWATTFFM